MSAESNITTFRDAGGLWEQHAIEEVATPQAWRKNPAKVLNFYNQRRAQLGQVSPNNGHLALAQLQQHYNLKVITQNVDNLHERAGSQEVLHLHGELTKAESELNPSYIVDLEHEPISLGDLCPQGGQLRPHVVWFGEAVPKMLEAEQHMATADFLIVVGTSLEVYPAAGLVTHSSPNLPKLVIDPGALNLAGLKNTFHWRVNATEGLNKLAKYLI